jgi:hypothetical protein
VEQVGGQQKAKEMQSELTFHANDAGYSGVPQLTGLKPRFQPFGSGNGIFLYNK